MLCLHDERENGNYFGHIQPILRHILQFVGKLSNSGHTSFRIDSTLGIPKLTGYAPGYAQICERTSKAIDGL